MADRKTTYAFVAVDKFSKTAGKVSKSAGMTGAAWAKAGKVAGVGLAAVGTAMVAAGAASAIMVKKSVAGASTLEETLNKSAVVFGKNSAAIERWGDSAARNLGLSKVAAIDAAAGFGMMFDQLGFGPKVTSGMSTALVNLAADLASFHDLQGGAAEATEMMSAAMRGEYDSLQRVIPTINAAAVQTEALRMTGKKNAKSLTEQEKAAATYSLIMSGAGKATGDFARTADSLANSNRTLAGEWKNASDKLGKIFLPAVQNVVRWFADQLLPHVDRAIDVFGDVARTINTTLGPAFRDLGSKWIPAGDSALEKFVDHLPDMAAVAIDSVNAVIKAFRAMANVVLNTVSGAASAIAWAFGWIDSSLEEDAKWFQNWKDQTIASLDATTTALDDTSDALRVLGVETRQPKTIDIVVRTVTEGEFGTRSLDAYKKVQREVEQEAQQAAAITADEVAKSITKTADTATKSTKKTTKAAKKMATTTTADLRNAFNGVMATIENAFEDSKQKIQSFRDEAVSLGRDISRGLGSFGENVADYAERMAEAVSPAKMLDNMQRSANAVAEWRGMLASVTAKGLPTDIVEELRAMGLDSGDELRALNQMTTAELQRFTALWRERDAAGAAEGAAQFVDDIAAEVAALPARLKQIGADAMAGLSDSVGKKAPQVTKQVKAALRAIADDISSEQALFAFEFDFDFVPKKSSGKKKSSGGKKKSSSKGGKGGARDGYSTGHGLLAATAGVGSPGARFGQWGPYWSWNRRNGRGQHDGADIRAAGGTPVYSTRGGRVLFAGSSVDRRWAGKHVMWEANTGTRFIYAHLSSISRGAGAIGAGTMLGRVGSTGNSTGNHLHVQASRSGHYVDPAMYLAAGGIVKARPGGTLAVIGEGRHDEAVVPLDGKNNLGGVTINIHGGFASAEEIARTTYKALADYQRSTGRQILATA